MSHGLNAAPGTAFCGPTAIAAITGATPEDVERLVIAYRKTMPPPRRSMPKRGRPVSTMWLNEIAPIMGKLGWTLIDHRQAHCQRVTFAQWQRETRGKRGTSVVLVTGHFVAVSGDWFVDSCNRNPIPLSKAPLRRKRVTACLTFEPRKD